MEANRVLEQLAGLAVVLVVAIVVFYVLRRGLVSALEAFAHRTASRWDDALHDNRVFEYLAHLPPALILTYGVQAVPHLAPVVAVLFQRVAFAIVIVVVARSMAALLSAVNEIYAADPETGRRSIKGYLQLLEIAVYAVAAILVVATLMDRSPLIFLSGLGAMTAVILLIFRDTLLGLVASVQIASNDMVRLGDWIEMPAYGADGDVVDIALHTVKIQNWDKTITTVPTSKLVEGSFKNWRGMSQSGGRRIKRAVSLDMNTVRFLRDDELEKYAKYALLSDYIAEKKRELAEYNDSDGRNRRINADIRRLTNIGTLRAYIFAYLKHHPKIHQGMTLLVRQQTPTAQGVPIEIYCFSNDTDWQSYEDIQADIFDHIFALLPDFGLRAFQEVSDYRYSAAAPDAVPEAPLSEM